MEHLDTSPAALGARADVLAGLNEAQAAAVTSPASPLRILAGAGSGKTRVLTRRIAHRALTDTLDPDRTLAVTFTRKAAGELRERLGRLGLRSGVQAGTFHSIAYAQLRQRWEERGVRPPELLDRKVGFVARLLRAGRGDTTPLDVVAELEWAAARRIGPEDYVVEAARARRSPPLPPERVAELYARYREEKRRRRLVDFDDLLRLAERDLLADPAYAAARHWRFRHLFVDEFQDVNPQQFALLRAWLGPESDLCVVGDPNQAIYAWNGADARYLEQFERFFPGGETVVLEQNYRSTPQVLTVANEVLAAGRHVPIRLRPNRPPGAPPTVHAHDDERAEAAAIARAVRDRHRPGAPWAAQAVLVRTNAQAAVVAEAFSSAGIPHRVRGAGDLLQQPEVRNALEALRRSPALAVALADLDEQVREDRAGEGSSQLSPERAANVAELVRLGREYLELDPDGGVAGFGAWLVSALRGEDRRGGDAVELVTFHAAKGLEWDVVHLAGLEDGFVPIHHARDDDDALDEERRLLYVALTRARLELHCTWARARTFGSRTSRRSPSPWLELVERSVGLAPAQLDRRRAAGRARAARSALGGTGSSADGQLFEALRAWRRETARRHDVPAFVVFNDETLRAVARDRPRTREQLLEVPGVGPVKVQRFGEDLLRIVAEHRDR